MAVAIDTIAAPAHSPEGRSETIAFFIMTAVLVVAPFFIYPLFLMQALCFALFACAFNLLIGYVGLLSFGHALYFGWASYAKRTHSAGRIPVRRRFGDKDLAYRPIMRRPAQHHITVGQRGRS